VSFVSLALFGLLVFVIGWVPVIVYDLDRQFARFPISLFFEVEEDLGVDEVRVR
jgi:hypothetical protein